LLATQAKTVAGEIALPYFGEKSFFHEVRIRVRTPLKVLPAVNFTGAGTAAVTYSCFATPPPTFKASARSLLYLY
jgi:hypothetical protein